MKAPDEFERRNPLSREEKQARKERKEAAARVATAENAKAAEEFARNRERLRAERLARETGAEAESKAKR
jgi:F0F1-type ATP synthase epsilon subunit